ncbi:hypothetical protein COLSTE_00869 [Collinsella stercoris DSM 13279]|uniref:Uncharacterized protein n=1 Tax=Collinsella stercoris DSM 13279 TaxID=445975 RepID=B6G9X8_9ACTN|nr:hypothetical protein COLSTE_00869 [Collinsella stercoris DSM 13279]
MCGKASGCGAPLSGLRVSGCSCEGNVLACWTARGCSCKGGVSFCWIASGWPFVLQTIDKAHYQGVLCAYLMV